jgi:hypothetical protein
MDDKDGSARKEGRRMEMWSDGVQRRGGHVITEYPGMRYVFGGGRSRTGARQEGDRDMHERRRGKGEGKARERRGKGEGKEREGMSCDFRLGVDLGKRAGQSDGLNRLNRCASPD